MSNQRLIDGYLARARELEDCVLRLEQNPPSFRFASRWRDAAFLRREAAWWRDHAQYLAKAG